MASLVTEPLPNYWEMDRRAWKNARGEEYEDSAQKRLTYEADPIRRTLWWAQRLAWKDAEDDGEEFPDETLVRIDPYDPESNSMFQQRAPAHEANLVSSLTVDGLHAPALDIDMPARLVPSRTPGHFHLFIDKPMKWWRYRILLRVLAWAGIIEKGYYRASRDRKMTMLRWDLDDWGASGRHDQLLVSELLQIRRWTGTVLSTEPKETS
jgi:hypothetical protein